MDGLIHANPYAQKIFEVYKPIAKTSVNMGAGVLIDLFYGFMLAGIFLFLFKSLPGETGVVKGISFALLLWFLRVIMSVTSSWMMFKIPANALIYTLITGLGEMLILGIMFGLTLKP
jgi:hypothetical protein